MTRTLAFTLFSVLFIALQTHASHTGSHSRILELNTDQTLINFLLNTRNLQQSDPKRSNDCFTYYLPQLTDCYDEYESDYSQCLLSSEDRRKKIDESTYQLRDEIEDSSENACKLLQNCVPNKDSIDYFECFESASNKNQHTMYNVSTSASDTLNKVRQAYSDSDYLENVCLVASKRKYDANNKVIYNNLQGCLNGETAVPTTTPPPSSTTTLKPTSSSTTMKPTTTSTTLKPTTSSTTLLPTTTPKH